VNRQLKVKEVASCILIVVLVCSLLYCAWINYTDQECVIEQGTVFQLAPFNTFTSGQYEGFMSYGELAKYGDFGIGTFEGLDGEMLAFDGVFYQIPSNGTPRVADDSQLTPYAVVTFFEPNESFTVSGLTYSQLQKYLDTQLDVDSDVIYAIKVSGIFDWAYTRSPQKQSLPYPELTEALKTESVFNLTSFSGTAVGFWFPPSMDGVDYAGYHMHLITDDSTGGGHVSDCIINSAIIEIETIHQYSLLLP